MGFCLCYVHWTCSGNRERQDIVLLKGFLHFDGGLSKARCFKHPPVTVACSNTGGSFDTASQK